jgi:hypothetical protein
MLVVTVVQVRPPSLVWYMGCGAVASEASLHANPVCGVTNSTANPRWLNRMPWRTGVQVVPPSEVT